MSNTLELQNIAVSVDARSIVHGVSLAVRSGETHVIMGPNGSGKSSLMLSLMGHPAYSITGGSFTFNQEDLIALTPDQRARHGLFLAFQYPREIEGITTGNFMRLAHNAMVPADQSIGPVAFIATAKEALSSLGLSDQFVGRFLNKGFSGGEKKRSEIAQMAILKPHFALLDEVDSGLDIDALKLVINVIKKIQEESGAGIIMVTHNPRIIDVVKPDVVHIMMDGKIVKSGGAELVQSIEEFGFDTITGAMSL